MQEGKIRLRAVELSDVDKIYLWENDTSVWDVSCNRTFFSRYAIEEFVKNMQNEDIFSSCQQRSIIEVEGKVVGCIDIYEVEPQHSRAGIGLYIEKEFRNKGYARQAVNWLEDYTQNVLGLHQLYCYIPIDNTPCITLFEKMNYFSSSILKQWIRKKGEYIDVKVYQKLF